MNFAPTFVFLHRYNPVMDARNKATAIDAATAGLEAAVSIVPLVGGPSAVILNRAFGSAVQRRNERILAELAEDVQLLIARLDLADPDTVLASEDFQAAVHRTLRAAQETASDEKRKLLRNGLLNGFVTDSTMPQRDQFMALMVRYQPEHVAVLGSIAALMEGRSEMLTHAATQIHDDLNEVMTFSSVLLCSRELVADGLAFESSESRVKEVNSLGRYGSPRTHQVAETTVWTSISDNGKEFLDFVTDPFANDPGQ